MKGFDRKACNEESTMKTGQYQKRKVQTGAALLALFVVCGIVTLADARVGGGSSMGSRGSRSFSTPARPSTPSPGGSFEQRAAPSSPYTRPYSQRMDEPLGRSTPYPQTSPYGGGGFWRSVGGGLLGGFLGSMLFRSLGFGSYGGAGDGGGGGGPGLFVDGKKGGEGEEVVLRRVRGAEDEAIESG